MKSTLQFILLFFIVPTFGQFKTYHLNQKLVYKSDEGAKTTFYYNKENGDELFYAYNNDNLETDSAILGARLSFDRKIWDLQVSLTNRKYVRISAYGELMKPYETYSTDYHLSDQLWDFGAYRDCKMLETQSKEGSAGRLYFYNRNDGQDYSVVSNNIVKMSALPPVKNPAKEISPGWILIYAETVDLKTDAHYSLSGTLFSVEKMDPVDLLFSEKQIDHYLSEDLKNVDYIIDAPYPIYCEVFATNGDVDQKTYDLVSLFLNEMCTFFDYYGRYKVEEFQTYFETEISKRAKIYKETKQLNSKQISKFIEEAMSNSVYNKEENLEKND